MPGQYELLPPLATTEREALQSSIIESKGLWPDNPIVVDENGEVLDGHNRRRIAEELGYAAPVRMYQIDGRNATEGEKRAFVYQSNLARRNLSVEQKREVLKDMKCVAVLLNQEGRTQEQIGALLAIDRSTVSRWLPDETSVHEHNTCIPSPPKLDCRVKVGKKGRVEIAERIASGETQVQVAADYGISRQQAGNIAKKETPKEEAPTGRVENGRIITGDFMVAGSDIPDATIDLIFTDPPYGNKHIPDYENLAIFAARTLKKGGSLLCYAGQSTLPKVLAVMTPHIGYWWTLAVVHGGTTQRFPGKWVFIEWKPIVWFVKGKRRDSEYVADVVDSRQDKEHHPWGQSTIEASYYIEHLTQPGQLVCDPFCGGGTTCVAAKQLGRDYLAFEINETTAAKARERLNG